MVADTPDITPVLDAADTIAARLSHATITQLMEMTRGGIGEPDAGTQVRARVDDDQA